jgi:putative two-component system response regulator
MEKIKLASLDTVYRLSRAAEYRDEDTGAHIQRMSLYSAAIARRLGFDDETVESILYAAPMHDIGKIGIPDRILLKPGRLDPNEWEIMKQHTIIGARILEGSDAEFIKLAKVIALTHHERWDGTGYPKGLKGSETPMVGRLTGIADVFDALISKRPYKKALSVEKSFDIIRDRRGSHFDPEVVDVFFAVENEILSVREKYKDEHESLLAWTASPVSSLL